jgi:SAM-dependent methyltransferase
VLNPPTEWQRSFDFVLESYTLQVLPPFLRLQAIEQIANFVAPGGTLLAICRGRDSQEESGQMPDPIARDELLKFAHAGLSLESFKDYLDEEVPPVRRFRATFKQHSLT